MAQDEYQYYIDGEWTDGAGDETFESANPVTDESLGTSRRGTPEDIDVTTAAADEACEEWRELSHIDRAECLRDIYHKLRDRIEELAEVVTKEYGKEISEGRADVIEAYRTVEWATGDARHPRGDVVPSEIPTKDAYIHREPRGVVGCITPWDLPIAIPFWHMAVALVRGNIVVWKPAEQTSWCGQIIVEMFENADIPDGVFNMVQGFGNTGASIVDDECADSMLFTGSAEVDHEVASKVAQRPGKLAAYEMGSKSSIVITEKTNLGIAIRSAMTPSFKTTGQRYVFSEHIVVHEDVYDEFKKRFVEGVKNVSVGDPLREDTFMDPLIKEGHKEKVTNYSELAEMKGVNILVGRIELDANEIPEGHESGHWIGPLVYEADPYGDLHCTYEEVFGPYVTLLRYSDGIEDAIEARNDTDYGLVSAVVSEDYRQINYFRGHAKVGLACGNLPCIDTEVHSPLGGMKKSGNGYPSARETIGAVIEHTVRTLNNSKEVRMAQGLSADIKTKQDD